MRVYTLDQARTLLPQVVPVIEEIRSTFLQLRALNASIAAHERDASGDGALLANPWEKEGGENRTEVLGQKLRQAIGRLDLWGIELKDPERGLVDFYHQRGGETVYLCYMLGEPDIGFWHTTSGGFASREPLNG